ncbi:hypothetical protein K239x_07390 [Planctomycetes bacterium K23_9]|uniref:Uncharacterized protein n=1 Tax=Stieleria marina TaxID=1930275 RepID=A0A517NNU4_9BACT|nr:hypothetical protein K239x_07390 [Planctomycetes bacterium K23_9]
MSRIKHMQEQHRNARSHGSPAHARVAPQRARSHYSHNAMLRDARISFDLIQFDLKALNLSIDRRLTKAK